MKASKLITKEQRKKMYGDYISLKNFYKLKITFEQWLIKEIHYDMS